MKKRITILILALAVVLCFPGCRKLGSAVGRAIKERMVNPLEEEEGFEPEDMGGEIGLPDVWEPILPPSEEEPEASETSDDSGSSVADPMEESFRAAYLDALREYRYRDMLPDGRQVNRPDKSDNIYEYSVDYDMFLYWDIDGDGYKELTIYFLPFSDSDSMTFIYQFDPDTQEFHQEFESSNYIQFYEGGYIVVGDYSFYYGDGELSIPFKIYQYNEAEDAYELKLESMDRDSIKGDAVFQEFDSKYQSGQIESVYYDSIRMGEQGFVFVMPTSSYEESMAEVNQYGFDGNGVSVLDYIIVDGTLTDCGSYYEADAIFYQQYRVRSDMQIGDTQTIYADGYGIPLTVKRVSEYDFAQVWEDGHEEEYPEYYAYGEESEEEWLLFQGSEDPVEAPIFRGRLRIRKDATVGVPIIDQYWTLEEKDIGRDGHIWYNSVKFDDEGYITELLIIGD